MLMYKRAVIGIGLWLLSLAALPAQAGNEVAIASAHPAATEAGLQIIEQGGNAFDAAVAVSAALAVVEPTGSGLGGGGFWLLDDKAAQRQVMIDGRETAPGLAHRDMYLDDNGEVNRDLSLNGPTAAGIPGEPAALVHIAENYGDLPLATLLAPAIKLAREGFAVTPHFRRMLDFRGEHLNPTARAVLLDNDHKPKVGYLIKQPELARTLERLAALGRDGFYRGETAVKLVSEVQKHGGIWTLKDLRDYKVVERPVVKGTYFDNKITAAGLPSAGGIVLISALNQLEALNYPTAHTTLQPHLLIEAMRRAYRDRNLYLGDSDFVEIPDRLTDKDYARELITDIDPDKAGNSQQMWDEFTGKGQDTTHFSVVDAEGNRVAATLSINYPFGSGFMVEGTGVLLNDEMDDFSARRGKPNAYGLVSDAANAIAPGKRPLSSMTPAFVDGPERSMVVGTPGGSRIISMVLQSVLHFDNRLSADEIVSAPRLHHQFLPDVVKLESTGFDEQFIDLLETRGHQVERMNRQYGDMQLIIQNHGNNQLEAASDPRGEGQADVRLIQTD